ncbi:uncharacterized protein L201_003509 [Kwoniella dendrophila CBS 6074]|uniref:Ketoreductase (KR) domain-containing protein n=1 Tax=Kwoniella dendrophila CBS 6074 TaxID=1295534 RepID=A0AAX4JTR2_9TREE
MTDFKAALDKLSSNSDNKSDQTVVIVGGTSGVGAGIARRISTTNNLGVSQVIICGRNSERGQAIAKLVEDNSENRIKARFIRGDVSTVTGIKQLAKDLAESCGSSCIQHLIQTQNGPPTGDVTGGEDGEDTNFFIQSISRPLLIHLLHESETLSPKSILTCIANPGQTLPDLSIDDLSLTNKKKIENKYRFRFFMEQSARDSCVLDASLKELSDKHPQYTFLHLFPGLVSSEDAGQFIVPFPLNIAFKIAFALFSATPDDYSAAPVYLTFHPEAESTRQGGDQNSGSLRLFDSKLKPMTMGAWASDSSNRKQLWEKLVKMLD